MLLSASSAEHVRFLGGCLQAKPYSVTPAAGALWRDKRRFPGRTPNPGRTGRDPLHPLCASQRSEGGIQRGWPLVQKLWSVDEEIGT